MKPDIKVEVKQEPMDTYDKAGSVGMGGGGGKTMTQSVGKQEPTSVKMEQGVNEDSNSSQALAKAITKTEVKQEAIVGTAPKPRPNRKGRIVQDCF